MDWFFSEIDPNKTGTDWQSVILFGIIAALVTYFAYRRGYFRLSPDKKDPPYVRFWHVLIGFSVYLFLLFFLSPLLGEMGLAESPSDSDMISRISWINFSVLGTTALFILIFFGYFNRNLFAKIVKNSDTPIRRDALLALFSWIISFPIVIVVSELLDGLTQKLFHLKDIPEQVAIQYFQMAQKIPMYLVIAFISIAILAPFVEEFMFRGLLQNWLKNRFGVKKAIFFSSILFACFHFSPSQGVGNISIVGALFVLALFLGFIYERQKSLVASFCLHSLFNILSMFNLLFIKS